ncbi:MAG TPA: RHS repeat-associated core domain-containing protein [Xylanibacter oryzae]|uniref:RHS repeat-associated core domain-containing protein n=1 Tax=Xylanibacter oryzae TaxID=185293 RepID=UPI0006857E4D|nr:RHS repeat-associated core domain-containing protein [Xylanibacter oryzae]HRN17194.1 RHS repeat-associated core domain-containing protein [Xylanibacter oryzae]
MIVLLLIKNDINSALTEVDGSQTGNVVQTIAYYPFGMQFCDGTTCYFDQKHKYNGKEFDNMHGLNTYDYGARQYNPVTARWDRMDRLCENVVVFLSFLF